MVKLEEIAEIKSRLLILETQVAANMEQLASIKANTQELLEAFNAAKGTVTFISFVGKIGKPVLYVGAAGALLNHYWDALIEALQRTR